MCGPSSSVPTTRSTCRSNGDRATPCVRAAVSARRCPSTPPRWSVPHASASFPSASPNASLTGGRSATRCADRRLRRHAPGIALTGSAIVLNAAADPPQIQKESRMPGTSTSAARGLDGVVAARTRLSHVDGDRGELIIGGYELKELAGRAHFEDAAHLLWRGALPTRDELGRLRRELAAVRAPPEETLEVVRAAATAPPIDALRMACATLSLDLANPDDISPTADLESAKRLTARFPTVLAAHARISEGNEPIAPRADLPHAANFLYMLHGTEPDPAAARAL